MRKTCPYCDSDKGYYYSEQSRYNVQRDWAGELINMEDTEIVYSGTKLKCLDCQEVVTSFAHGLQRELDNG